MTDYSISKATAANWQRLSTDGRDRLTQRANKTRSQRRVVALSYTDSDAARQLLARLLAVQAPVADVVYTVCRALLAAAGLWPKPHVQRAMAEYAATCRLVDCPLPEDLLREALGDGCDVPGFLYQSLITEGERNSTGQYYTHPQVVADMLSDAFGAAGAATTPAPPGAVAPPPAPGAPLVLRAGERLLDPCCGSGALLLAATTATPEALCGYDINPVAVMMARTNLLIKYGACVFDPQVYCLDFLADGPSAASCAPSGAPDAALFDYICTNPPWGADRSRRPGSGATRERSSLVLLRALPLLRPGGRLCCLLPLSLLTIHTHHALRAALLGSTTIHRLRLYSSRFDGVFTRFFSITLRPVPCQGAQCYTVVDDSGPFTVALSDGDRRRAHIAVARQSAADRAILAKVDARRHDDLAHSRWALGIITGNNRSALRPAPCDEADEPVYTGRQVQPFVLTQPTAYIRFAPQQFQQCAPEAVYRAPEKLVYRFIADRPVVAYDDRRRLCLNSANIIIPRVDTLSARAVCALLNSSLYAFYYRQLFHDIKVLKSNLCQLPFPRLSPEQDARLSALVATASAPAIDRMVYDLFGITAEEQAHIRRTLAG